MNVHLIASGPSYKLFKPEEYPGDIFYVNAPWLMKDWLQKLNPNFKPSAWFEMHSLENLLDTLEFIVRNDVKISVMDYYTKLLPSLEEEIYMQRKDKNIPKAVEYPLDTMLNQFGRVFTSSASYMLALAIYKRPVKIYTWGIHMNSKGEYKYQREGYQYLLHIAETKGIELVLNTEDVKPEKNNFNGSKYLYGYDWKDFIKEN